VACLNIEQKPFKTMFEFLLTTHQILSEGDNPMPCTRILWFFSTQDREFWCRIERDTGRLVLTRPFDPKK